MKNFRKKLKQIKSELNKEVKKYKKFFNKKSNKKIYNSSNFALFAFTLFVFAICSFNLKTYLTPKETPTVLAATSTYQEELRFLTDLVFEHPDYIDGWIELARLDHKHQNPERVQVWIAKAESINPNSPKLIELKKELGI